MTVPMKKRTAYNLFGGQAGALAAHLGVTTRTVYNWPQDLPRHVALMALGARVLLNARIKKQMGTPLDALEAELADD